VNIVWFCLQKDVKNLEQLFKKLNVETNVHSNMTYIDVLNKTECFTQDDAFRDASMCIFVIMAHGRDDSKIFTANGKPIEIEEIIDLFDDRKCPNLKGKPKWLIFQV